MDSTHSLDRDELRDLRKLRQSVKGLYVFETERGGPRSVDALAYIVREAGKRAKLDVEAHPHQLRHAAGYMLVNEGTDTRLIQAFLGHKDIRHTAHYKLNDYSLCFWNDLVDLDRALCPGLRNCTHLGTSTYGRPRFPDVIVTARPS